MKENKGFYTDNIEEISEDLVIPKHDMELVRS